jgi:hypothetical protein
MTKRKIPNCPECGQRFENVFDATDHILEDEDDFDPALILPNGYKLMIGSLLRAIYASIGDDDKISDIVESTYVTLFTAETRPNMVAGMIQDIIVSENMTDIDSEIKNLLDKSKDK